MQQDYLRCLGLSKCMPSPSPPSCIPLPILSFPLSIFYPPPLIPCCSPRLCVWPVVSPPLFSTSLISILFHFFLSFLFLFPSLLFSLQTKYSFAEDKEMQGYIWQEIIIKSYLDHTLFAISVKIEPRGCSRAEVECIFSLSLSLFICYPPFLLHSSRLSPCSI